MEQTTNYNLNLPAYDDLADIEKINENTRIIDTNLKQAADKAAAALPSSSYTATDILNKLKTVDGANSGLDADLFKGESTIPVANGGTGKTTAREAYRNLAYGGYTKKITDFNIYVASGYYIVHGESKNSPIDMNYWIMLEVMSGGIENTYMIEQTATVIQFTSASVARKKFYRHCYSSSTNNWSDWVEIVTTDNIATMMNTALQSGGVSVVKSIQRGIISMGQQTRVKTATINAVNTNKAFVIYTGVTITDSASNMWPYLELTNSTTVTATRLANPVNDGSITTVPYQVIEYY